MNDFDLRQLKEQYPYSKPRYPAQFWLLVFITTGGLIALFFAALTAFSWVANPIQAFFAAMIIEAGLVIEALALIKRPRSVYTWGGLFISFVVSGTYNYTQAARAAAELNWWVLGTLAFGPLSALAFVSLTLGNELRAYQEMVAEWERNRALWTEKERNRLERKEERRQERIGKVAGRVETENLPQTSANLPSWLPAIPNNLREFKYMVDEGIIILPPGLTGQDLLTHIPSVGTDRTGRNWLSAVNYRSLETNGKH